MHFILRFVLIVLMSCLLKNVSVAQTTYDFSTAATLSYGSGGFGIWYTQADITIGGVAYKLTCGGNGSFANAASGGSSNSKCLTKDGSGGDQFTIERTDGQPFQFYGFWVKHKSMNSYAQFYSLPPFYTITYNKYGGGTESYSDNTAMQGGSYTSSSVSFTKDIAVTSVSVSFQAITNFWIDDISVGPVSIPTPPTISSHPVNKTICAGANTTFSVTAANATSYQWQVNTGSGYNNISNSAPYSGATTSTLTITSATAGMNGYLYRCVATGSGNVTSNAATLTVNSVSASTSKTDVSCNGGSNGTATVTASGGASPYTYSWAPSGGTGATATGLAAGAYTVTVTDNNTCSTTKTVTVTQPTALSATTSKTNVSCNGGSNGTATVAVTGGTPSYTYSWAPSGGTAATATGLAPGTYTCTITDANACTLTKNFTITQPTALSANISTQTNVACNGGSNGSATVSVTGGTPAYTYSWAPSGGTAATATGLAAGAYTVTITDANSCTATQSVTITQPTAISATTSKTNVSCNGGSNGTATVVASGGTGAGTYTYSWAPSGGTAATATGLAVGNYTCTITDANSCSITRGFTITQPSALSASTSKTNVSCNGAANGAASVSVTGGTPSYTYSWAPSGGTAATATGLAAGTYTVTITDANACSITRSFTITQPTALSANIITQTNVACNGGSNGSATVSVTGGTPAYTYSWAPSGGTAATATGLAAGTYTVTITDANACTSTKSVTITQPTALSSTISSQTNVACYGGSNGSATVSVTGGTPSYTYSWAPSGGTAATATGLAAGTYTVTITDANACTSTKSVTITQPAALSATSSQTNVSCNGGSNGTASVSVTGGTGSYTYSWVPGGGTAATASGLTAGTYTVTVTDANECTTTKSFTITQPAVITASATPSSSTICSGSTTDIGLTSVPSGASFTWTVNSVSGSVSGASAGSGNTIEQTLSGNGVINYIVSYTNGTCSGSPVTIPVTVNALTAITDQPVSTGNIDEHESADFSVKADYASTYQWQVNEGEGFVNINNNETYTGVQTDKMTVISATESMNGYVFRCIVSGNCSPVTSEEAILNVKLRTPQHITLASTNQVIYGADDFSPEGVSDAGLEITYTSSDIAIAEIINGKIHVKQAGEVTITASQAGNVDYKPATAVTQLLTIAKKDITVSLNATPAIAKTYDGATSITLAAQNYTLNGVVGNDDVYVTGASKFDDSKAGNNKNIVVNNFILNGEQKGNYNLTTLSADVAGSIAKKEITVALNATPEISKTYDGTSDATLSGGNYTLSGIVGEDVVNVSGSAHYDDKNVGGDKGITVNNFELQGNDKDNYQLVTLTASTAGSITAKPITVSMVAQPEIFKVYDGNANATLNEKNYVLQGIEGEDDVTVSGTAMYDNRHAGEDKTVIVNEFVLGGGDKNNYSLETTSAVTTGVITQKSLTVSLLASPAITKQYDGNRDATIAPENYSVNGIVGEDNVLLNIPGTGIYDTEHGGINKKVTVIGLAISGEDANDYKLESTRTGAEVGIITKKAIAVSAEAQTKVYGAADPVLSYTTEGKLEEDMLPGSLGREEGKHVGTYAINIGTLSGGDDYEIENFSSAALVITPAPLVIKADSKTKKQGTANPAFSFTYDGLAEGDAAADLDSLPVATTNATTGSPIGSYDIKAQGAASHDYIIAYEDGKLTVTPAGGEEYNMKVWSSSPDVIQVRIYSAVAQKATITLYTEVGQKVIIEQKQLNAGINSYSIYAGNLASSTYVLGVMAEKFKDAQKVKVK